MTATTLPRDARARKGDLVAAEVCRTVTYQGARGVEATTYWIVGTAARCTRDGHVAAVTYRTEAGYATTETVRGHGANHRGAIRRVLTMPRRKVVDRDAILATVAGERYPDPDTVRAVLRPYVNPDA